MEFGLRLREIREQSRLSRKELAQRLGVSYWAISKYETGERQPDSGMLQRMADLFDVSVDDLLGRTSVRHVVIAEAPNPGTVLGFGARLRSLRQEHELSQRELGEALGVGNTTVSQWESEANEPGREMMAQMADFFGVTTDYLISGRTSRRSEERHGRDWQVPPDLAEAIRSLPEEQRHIFLRAKNLTPDGLRSVVDYIKFKLAEEEQRTKEHPQQ